MQKGFIVTPPRTTFYHWFSLCHLSHSLIPINFASSKPKSTSQIGEFLCGGAHVIHVRGNKLAWTWTRQGRGYKREGESSPLHPMLAFFFSCHFLGPSPEGILSELPRELRMRWNDKDADERYGDHTAVGSPMMEVTNDEICFRNIRDDEHQLWGTKTQ